jgi:hypothetical protein
MSIESFNQLRCYDVKEFWETAQQFSLGSLHASTFKMLDHFQDSANMHRLEEGIPLEIEKDILDDAVEIAERFLCEARRRKSEFKQRTSEYYYCKNIPPVVFLTQKSCPEVISNEVMSYLYSNVRLEGLRTKYTNDYLREKLSKKTNDQLEFIFVRLSRAVREHVYNTTPREIDDGDVMAYSVQSIIKGYIAPVMDNWRRADKKHQKPAIIVSIYQVAERLLYHKIINWSVYEIHCQQVIKLLHMLVIASNKTRLTRKPLK